MPSAEHESPVALARSDPDLVAWLLANLFKINVPDYHHARGHTTDVRVMVPRTYHADSMVLFCDPADRPLLAVVLEVQRGRDPGKRRTWKLYVAHLEAELNVDAALVVYCPGAAVARWYRRLVKPEGLSLPLRPFIFTPDEVPLVRNVRLARANPALAVLSAIWRGCPPLLGLVGRTSWPSPLMSTAANCCGRLPPGTRRSARQSARPGARLEARGGRC